MTFTLLPAVDVANGQSVRLVQGSLGTSTASGDPFAAALTWQASGAEWVHLVDIDSAFRRGSNVKVLGSIVQELDVNVQLAGGIADDASLTQALATGCERVVLAPTAVEDPSWCARAIAAHGDRVAVGLDVGISVDENGVRRHRLAARGQSHDSGDLWETIRRLDLEGCARYVVTDVSKDGMMSGPNFELYRAMADATDTPIVASGGVSTIDDLRALAELAAGGATLEGAIVGKSLYAGQFTMAEALVAMRQLGS